MCVCVCVCVCMCFVCLVWFYGISTLVGHLMPNPFYTYVKYDLLTNFEDNIFKQAWDRFFLGGGSVNFKQFSLA